MISIRKQQGLCILEGYMKNQNDTEDMIMRKELEQYLEKVRIPYLGRELYSSTISISNGVRWMKSPKSLLEDFTKKYKIENEKEITGSVIEAMLKAVDCKYWISNKEFFDIKADTDTFKKVSQTDIFSICVAYILTEEDRNKLLEVFHIHLSPMYYDEDAIFEFFTSKYKYSLDNINSCQFNFSTHQEVLKKYVDCMNYGIAYIKGRKNEQDFININDLLWRGKNGE